MPEQIPAITAMAAEFLFWSLYCQRAVLEQSHSTSTDTVCLHMQKDLQHAACECCTVTQWALLNRKLRFRVLPIMECVSKAEEVAAHCRQPLPMQLLWMRLHSWRDALRTGHMPSQLTEAVNGGVAAMDEA